MHRDVRLQGLSTDHHHALVLARTIHKAFDADRVDTALIDETYVRFERELKPHFAVEEELLLPALEQVGHGTLSTRTRSEHAELRAFLRAARQGDFDALRSFGVLLQAHVRFEEGELFPICEQALDDDVLDAVAARAPK